MADSATLLVDEVLPYRPVRQWEPSVPSQLRLLFASQPVVMGKVLSIVYRAIATHLTHKAGFRKAAADTGAVTLVQMSRIHLLHDGRCQLYVISRWLEGSSELAETVAAIVHSIGVS